MKLLASSTAFMAALCVSIGVQAAESLTEDSTQRHYERKVQMQVADMGLESRSTTLPVTLCLYEKKCINFGAWTFSITQDLENKASAQVLERLSGNRYDTLALKPGKLEIRTLTESVDVDSTVGDFQFDVGAYSDFKQRVDSYLDKNIAPLMGGLLAKAKDARYQEMKDKERETFLAEIAKEQSVPALFIQKLMNSAFVFSLYSHRPSGEVEIRQVKDKKSFRFKTTVDVNSRVTLLIHRFNADSGKFEFYKEQTDMSGTVAAAAEVYPTQPGFETVIGLFGNSYIVAAKAAGIASNISLKDDDNFAIFATVDEINAPSFSSQIGENEDLRVDAPYYVSQQIDGRMQKMGFGKARKVASKKTFTEAPADYQSRFSLIKGDMEIKDQLREHPWSGALWNIGVGSSTFSVTEIDGTSVTGGGAFVGLQLGTKADLGYFFNAESLSEKWLELQLTLGSGGEAVQGVGYDYEAPFEGVLSIDFVVRKHLGSSGMYWAYKLGIGAAGLSAASAGLGDDLTVIASGLDYGLQAGYLVSPNFEFYSNVGGFLPFNGKAKIGSGTELDAQVAGGLGFSVGIAMHMKSIGGMARMMR